LLLLLSAVKHHAGPLVVGITVAGIAVGVACVAAGAFALDFCNFSQQLLPVMWLFIICFVMSFVVAVNLGAAAGVPQVIYSALSLFNLRHG
jgi:hypothetical protein